MLTKTKIRKIVFFLCVICLTLSFFIRIYANLELKSFSTDNLKPINNINNINSKSKCRLNAKIAILTDIHYLSPEYVSEGKAFEDYLVNDRKLIAESSAILRSVVNELKHSDVDLVFVTGDLTKDGEKKSHIEVANYLRELERAGKKVYVIPGNHDINNPNAQKYLKDDAISVENITPTEFKEIYKEFGYNESKIKDKNSLSYVAEPVKGMKLLAIDSCIYNTNKVDNKPNGYGELTGDRLSWIKEQLNSFKNCDDKIFGMMHHNLIEHFDLQQEYFEEFVIRNSDYLSNLFANSKMSAIFTGHYHANDITSRSSSEGNKIYDIETNSTVTYPCSYRLVDIKGNLFKTYVKNITKIDYDTKGLIFSDYAEKSYTESLHVMIPNFIKNYLIKQGMTEDNAILYAYQATNTKLNDSYTLNDLLVDAMKAHYKGDEAFTDEKKAYINSLLSSNNKLMNTIGMLSKSLSTDINTSDDNLKIEILK